MAPRSQHLFAIGYTALLIIGLAALWFRPAARDLPAWVQAIGSVVAIFVAVGLAQWQADRARRDRMEERQEYRRAVAALARRLADVVQRDADDMADNPTVYIHEGLDTSEYLLLDAALDRFDPARLISAEAVVALEELRRSAMNASFWAEALGHEYRGEVYYDGDLPGSIRAWGARVQEKASILERVASAAD